MRYFDSFIQYLEVERRYAEHTLTAYKKDLTQFFEYLEEQYEIKDPTEASHQEIRSWIIALLDKNISTRTINRKLSALKTFYKFLLRQQHIEVNPMRKVTAPKMSKKLPVFVEEKSVDLLFGKVDFGQGFAALRNRLILEILYATGIRVAELVNMKETDVDLSKKVIKVLGKRNKERFIPISPKLIKLINGYLKQKSENFEKPAPTLLVTDKGEKLYPKFVYRKVKKYLDLVTTVEKRSPHVLRHTFATHMSNSGADLNSIKELLGHANLAATQVYTHNTIEKLKKIYKKSHPKA